MGKGGVAPFLGLRTRLVALSGNLSHFISNFFVILSVYEIWYASGDEKGDACYRRLTFRSFESICSIARGGA